VELELIRIPFRSPRSSDAREWPAKSGGKADLQQSVSRRVDVIFGTTLRIVRWPVVYVSLDGRSCGHGGNENWALVTILLTLLRRRAFYVSCMKSQVSARFMLGGTARSGGEFSLADQKALRCASIRHTKTATAAVRRGAVV